MTTPLSRACRRGASVLAFILVIDEGRGVIPGDVLRAPTWPTGYTQPRSRPSAPPVERLWNPFPSFPARNEIWLNLLEKRETELAGEQWADTTCGGPAERVAAPKRSSRRGHPDSRRSVDGVGTAGAYVRAPDSHRSDEAALRTLTRSLTQRWTSGSGRVSGSQMVDMLAKWLLLASELWGVVMKVLVIASEPISADRLRAALGGASDNAEIMVVAPALHRSVLRFWLSDADEAIRRAELVQRETVEGLDDAGIDARGDSGEGDPVKAVEDVLVTFPAERIVLFTRPVSEQRYHEGIDADALQQRFGLPVLRAE